MKKYLIVITLIALSSCKSKAVLAEAKAKEEISTKEIITRHYASAKDFSTLMISANARYRDQNQSQAVTAEIKIKKDEKILVSVRFLGITMAKALITPTGVKYYEKINSQYFEGDYGTLSKWLGTDLDFQKVQNMLIGEAMDDLSKSTYENTIEDQLYKLSQVSNGTSKAFYFEASKLLIKRQQIEQKTRDRMLLVTYPNHKEYDVMTLPAEFVIEATNKGKKTTINMDYNKVSFNEDLSFPYSVPGDYERINID